MSIADIYSGQSTSWVIKNRLSGEVLMETFNKDVALAINAAKYEAVSILTHLQSLNVRV